MITLLILFVYFSQVFFKLSTTAFRTMEWKKSTIGFGADGASVNLGKRQGVASLLKPKVRRLIDIHCLPHRLELSMLEMQQECKYVKEVYNILHLVWKTYHFSPKSKRELQASGNELGLDVLKPRSVKGSKWLPHVSGALRDFMKPVKDGSICSDPAQYAVVLAHMEHLATTSTNADVNGRDKFIAKAMKKASLVTFCHFLLDVCDVLSKLSFHFQRDDLTLPSAVSLLEEALSSISLVAKRPVRGGTLQAFLGSLSTLDSCSLFQGITLSGDLEIDENAGVGAQIKQAANFCLSGLRAQFGALLQAPDQIATPGPKQVVKDLLVFNHDAWPTAQSELILGFHPRDSFLDNGYYPPCWCPSGVNKPELKRSLCEREAMVLSVISGCSSKSGKDKDIQVSSVKQTLPCNFHCITRGMKSPSSLCVKNKNRSITHCDKNCAS